MILVLCFLYCFFAVVLGLYLGLELISVRRADRMARTLWRSAVRLPRSEGPLISPDSGAPCPAEPNYFKTK